jgi:hypothetical protein
MKKMIALLDVVFFAIAVFAFAANAQNRERLMTRKVMQERTTWLEAISKNLEINKNDKG